MKTAFTILLFLFLSSGSALGQTTSKVRHPAIALFEQARFGEATRALEIATKTDEFKSDAELWNYLGLSYLATNEAKKARKAFEKSVSLNASSSVFRSNLAYSYLMNGQIGKARDSADKAIALDAKNAGPYQVRGLANFWQRKLDLAERDADLFIRLDPSNPAAYLLKSDILVAKMGDRFMSVTTIKEGVQFLNRAAESLEIGSAKCVAGAGCSEIARRREAVTAFYEHFSADRTPPASPLTPAVPEPGVTPVKITSQPHARYTDKARTDNVQGAIRVAILLGASGKVEHVLFLSRLGHGLDEEVLKAVLQIKFEPKKKDGKPVPVVVVREYTFTIY